MCPFNISVVVLNSLVSVKFMLHVYKNNKFFSLLLRAYLFFLPSFFEVILGCSV